MLNLIDKERSEDEQTQSWNDHTDRMGRREYN